MIPSLDVSFTHVSECPLEFQTLSIPHLGTALPTLINISIRTFRTWRLRGRHDLLRWGGETTISCRTTVDPWYVTAVGVVSLDLSILPQVFHPTNSKTSPMSITITIRDPTLELSLFTLIHLTSLGPFTLRSESLPSRDAH